MQETFQKKINDRKTRGQVLGLHADQCAYSGVYCHYTNTPTLCHNTGLAQRIRINSLN